MKCLLGQNWAETTLDYHRDPGDYRIKVLAFANLEKLDSQYLVRPRSFRMLWNYLLQVGPVSVWRKATSRFAERFRNEKYLSLGFGEVVDSPRGGKFEPGQKVCFFAPNFPACVERVVLAEDLILVAEDHPNAPPLSSNEIYFLPFSGEQFPEASCWQFLRHWSKYSGELLSDEYRKSIARDLVEIGQKLDWSPAQKLLTEPSSEVCETYSASPKQGNPQQRKATLFGYGHYAKTNILPNIRGHIFVQGVHEIDPTQVPNDGAGIAFWDTSPTPRENEQFDIAFIASYHHTHVPLAVAALERGAYAVVEKPLAVDHSQLETLLEAVESTSGKGYFSCFHKRYSPLNAHVHKDLNLELGDPIDYHCIVYEIPLPNLHWYNWPNSKSRLISNGCHWIDHFLFLNDFCEVRSFDLSQSDHGTINCSVSLENGAFFSMLLTDVGAERIGLQEYVELRAGEASIKITNNSDYMAEDRHRVLRRCSVNKTFPYKKMYQVIAAKIACGERGDSIRSIRVSTQLVLDLEEALNELNDARAIDQNIQTKL